MARPKLALVWSRPEAAPTPPQGESGAAPAAADVINLPPREFDRFELKYWVPTSVCEEVIDYARPYLVLDPFNGTGTTGAVAKKLGRRFIGIEREKKYAKAAEKRIAGVEVVPSPSIAPFVTAREAPRVAFSALIERGLVTPGALLTDAKKRHKATVRADGAVSLGDTVGSIHRIGALAQGLDACNGWTFWHVETPKGLMPIDEFRAIVRSEMAEAAE